MHMYVANGTRQIQEFHYRLPESTQVRVQKIPVGQQIKISGDLRKVDIDAIVKQHSTYGLIHIDEIDSKGSYASMIYQIDKVISPIAIERLMRRNTGELMDRGREQRQNAAVVLASQIGNSMKENGVDGDLESVEVSTTEHDDILAQTRRAATGDDRFDEKTIVVKEGSDQNAHKNKNKNKNKGR